jgi:hypothetical protein
MWMGRAEADPEEGGEGGGAIEASAPTSPKQTSFATGKMVQ